MVKGNKIVSLLVILVLVAALGAAIVPASPVQAQATWYVDGALGTDNTTQGTGPGINAFKTINHAISQASAIDTINVAAGTYTITGAITVDKGVTITGNTGSPSNVLVTYSAPSTTLDCFDMQANDITVQGIKVVNGRYGFNFAGSDSTGCTISNCVIHHCYKGAINIDGGSGHTISDNTITNCLTSGTKRGVIHIYCCPNTTIDGNTLTDNGLTGYHATMGIYVKFTYPSSPSERVEVISNNISGMLGINADIQIYDAPYTYIYNNTISNSEDKGIAIWGIDGNPAYTSIDNRVEVIGNTISSTSFPGLQACNAPYTYFYNNTLTHCNYYGDDGTGDWDYASIHIDVGSSDCLIDSNTVSDGINGIQLWSDDCTITNNTIYDMGKTYADTKTTTDSVYHNSAILYGDMYDVNMPTSATISFNNIYDNYWGLFVISAYTGTVAAENNWWSDATGADPDTEANNPHGAAAAGDKVSDNVDFTPWYATATTTPTTQNVSVDHTFSSIIAYSDTIQGGIDAALAGDTINVAAGTYDSSVETFPIVINESLTLLGAQVNVDPRPSQGGRTGNESIIDADETSSAVIQISASDVEINGFTITGGTDDMVEEEEGSSAHNLLFSYNILYDDLATAGDEAIQIKYSDGVVIEYNYAYNILQDAFNLSSSSNGVVRYNEAHDINSENAAIYCYDATNIDIIGNLVYNVPNNDGIKLGAKGGGDASKTGGLIKDNVVHDTRQDGITVYMSGVTVEGNEVYNSSSENGAIYLARAISDITIRNNSVHDNTLDPKTKWSGKAAGILIGTHVDASTVTINFNNIYNNSPYGVTNEASDMLVATNNWWGDAAEPSAQVSDNVDYDPWANGLRAFSGTPQTGPVGTALANPFVAQLKNSDDTDVAISGITATYAITDFPAGATGHQLSDTSPTTDPNGRASSTLTLGNKSGTYTVTANVPGESTATFTATATAGSLDHIVVSPDTANVTAGNTQTYTAEAFDQYNNSRGDVTNGTTFEIDAGAGGSWAANVYTSENGGTWTVTGTYNTKSDTATLTVNPATSGTVTLTANPDEITADGTSTSTITATVNDQYGNPVADGTDVEFETDHGTFASSTVTKQTSDGVATATLTSESSTETVIATVTATANGVSDATAAFFIPAGGPDVEESETETVSGSGTVTDTPTGGDVTIDATGDHTITTAKYTGNPGGTPGFRSSGNYYDVHLDDDTGVNSLTVEFCPANEDTVIYYWNGTSWGAASNQSYSDGCVTVTITATTSPSLPDLSGLPFGSGTPVAPVGVGGGVGAWTPPTYHAMNINMLGKITTARVSFSGELLDSVTVADADNKFALELDKGTKIVCANNQPPQRIELTLARSLPPPPGDAVIVEPIYELSAYTSKYDSIPSPITISPAASLALAYNPDNVPENTRGIIIAYYDEDAGKWIELETAGYVAGGVEVPNTVTSQVSHFTHFAVLAKLAEVTPAKFETRNLTINPSQAELNQEITISVELANSGGTSGDYSLKLKIDGITKSSKQITVAAGATQTVSFTITGDAVGKHRVEVAGLIGEFEIIGAVEQPSGVNWWLIGSILGIIGLHPYSWTERVRRVWRGSSVFC